MTQAARILYMTQPSVSQAIAELEKYYGVRLFERLNHRLYLTAAGDRLQFYARHMLNLTEEARKELADICSGGLLRVGASQTTGAYLMPRIVAAYRKQMPQVEVFTIVDNTSVIENMILEDRIDLGLVEGAVNSPDIVEEFIQDDGLILVGAPQHPLAMQKDVSISDLAAYPIIVREKGSGTRDVFENAMHQAEVAWKIGGVYNNTEAIKQAVRMNLGLAVIPEVSAAEDVRLGSLVPLKVRGLKLARKFNLVYHRQKFFTRAMQVFSDSIRP
jgi:DNA-binding transcriptional LysR family regulator